MNRGHLTRYAIMAAFSVSMYLYFDLPSCVAVCIFTFFGGGLHFLMSHMERPKGDRS